MLDFDDDGYLHASDLVEAQEFIDELSDFGQELSKLANYYIKAYLDNRGKVKLPRREVSGVHLTDHAANTECLQVLVLKFDECAAMANDTKKVDIVALLANFFALAEAKELHHLRHAVHICKRESLEYICVLIEDLKDALGLVRIDVCSQSHLAWVPLS